MLARLYASEHRITIPRVLPGKGFAVRPTFSLSECIHCIIPTLHKELRMKDRDQLIRKPELESERSDGIVVQNNMVTLSAILDGGSETIN